MSLDYVLRISASASIAGQPADYGVTTGNFYLRKEPYSSNTYTGNHIGNGNWDFGTIEDGNYELWTTSKQVNYGRRYLGDKNPTFDSVNVTGAVFIGGALSVTGDLTVTGQTNFYDSVNLNHRVDLANALNIQCRSISEESSNKGIEVRNPLVLSDANRIKSDFPSLSTSNTFGFVRNFFQLCPEISTGVNPSLSGLVPRYYAEQQFGKINAGNNWTATNNFSQYPLFNGSGNVTLPKQFTTKEYVDNAVLTANFGSITASFVNQVSTNVIRLLANGIYSNQQKVAPTWALAMKMAKDSITGSSSSATKQMIISIEGIGETDIRIPITNSEIGTYLYPNVHIKGVSQSVAIEPVDDAINSGTVASKCLFENLTILKSGDATPSFSNITFKDCYFDMDITSLGFTNCMFRGTNIFKMYSSTLTLNSCSGATYYTTVIPTEVNVTPPYIHSAYL